jgi:deoxyribodipyrimidine photolyase-related protein
MDGDEPEGGEWNYDDRNREFLPADWDSPPRLAHEPDALTERTADWVTATFDTWGEPRPFEWPVTRDAALAQLDHFLEHRLPAFGPYQDAMRADDWAMAHALLSPALNLGLLRPAEVVAGAVEAFRTRSELSLASVEGFVRQILGWREFVRHAYRRGMPALAAANQLGAERPLPACYWTGETDMACLAGAIEDVRSRGYAHHIQRLMVLANVATLWGVRPAALNEWFHATFVDAYHWVTTPNVVEMGAYGDGLFATKPYVASANYVDRMSNYCGGCQYDPDARTGDGACPLNALYWDFLARNEDQLRSNHRMGLMYGHLDDKRDSGELAAVQDRVDQLRTLADRGVL